jgi:hypothetical protein
VIAPLDSRLCILNPVNHFSTHLRPAKEKPLWLYLCLALLDPSLPLDHHVLHFMCISTMIIISCPCTISLWSCGHLSLPHTPSSHVLLVPNSKHLTHGISNLVSLITKTKLGLSPVWQFGRVGDELRGVAYGKGRLSQRTALFFVMGFICGLKSIWAIECWWPND